MTTQDDGETTVEGAGVDEVEIDAAEMDAAEIDETDAEEERTAALAEAYNSGLRLEKSGDVNGAVAAYREALEIDPADPGGVIIRLARLGVVTAPETAPPAYVATLFDQNAEEFDTILVDDLGYCVPLLVRDALPAGRTFARALDLGCGTGLSGQALRERVGHLSGVDLSEGMLDLAFDKEVYDALFVGDAVGFLEAEDGQAEDGEAEDGEAEDGQAEVDPYEDAEKGADEGGDASADAASHDDPAWDLIVATDVLPYLGALEPLFDGVARRLQPNGLFAFSSETLSLELLGDRPYCVGPKHRFAHAEWYLRALAAARGLEVAHLETIVVRADEGDPIPGHLMIVSAPASRAP